MTAWITEARAAEYLDVTPRTVRNYIRRGDLPASRIKGSRQIRIKLVDVEAMMRPVPIVRKGDAA